MIRKVATAISVRLIGLQTELDSMAKTGWQSTVLFANVNMLARALPQVSHQCRYSPDLLGILSPTSGPALPPASSSLLSHTYDVWSLGCMCYDIQEKCISECPRQVTYGNIKVFISAAQLNSFKTLKPLNYRTKCILPYTHATSCARKC